MGVTSTFFQSSGISLHLHSFWKIVETDHGSHVNKFLERTQVDIARSHQFVETKIL